MNQKEQIRKELNEYLDKYIPRTELDIYKYVVDFIKKDRKKQLTLTDVVSSFNLEIKDRDIATIEALHDTLLDEKVLGLNARSMKESRALTQRMYKALSKD